MSTNDLIISSILGLIIAVIAIFIADIIKRKFPGFYGWFNSKLVYGLKKAVNVKTLEKFFLTYPLVGLIIIAIFIIRLLSTPPSPPPVIKKISIAIMPFKNYTRDETLKNMIEALDFWLIRDLSQSTLIRTLDEDQVFRIRRIADPTETRDYTPGFLDTLANLGGIEYIVAGNCSKVGDTLRINFRVHKVGLQKKNDLQTLEGICESSILPMVDSLTVRIKGGLGLSSEEIKGDIDYPVRNITTTSSEAVSFYRQAEKTFFDGAQEKSLYPLEMAVESDSSFAMAYRFIAMVYHNLERFHEYRNSLQSAFECKQFASERERYLIEGDYYSVSEDTHDKAEKAYDTLLQLYPDDLRGSNNLGTLYKELEEWDKALERFRNLVENNPKAILLYENPVLCYEAKGSYEEGRQLLDAYIDSIDKNSSYAHYLLAAHYFCKGDDSSALREWWEANNKDPEFYGNLVLAGDMYHLKGDWSKTMNRYLALSKRESQDKPYLGLHAQRRLVALYLSMGHYASAESVAKNGIEVAKKKGEMAWESTFHRCLAYIHLKSGNPKKALAECDSACSTATKAETEPIFRQIVALHLKGLAYVEMGSIDKAQQVAEELQDLTGRTRNKKTARFHSHLMGMIHFKGEKSYNEAIDCFNEAIRLLPSQSMPLFPFSDRNDHALFLEPLALAWIEKGDLDSALAVCDRIVGLTSGRLFYGDIFAKCYVVRGKIYEKKGFNRDATDSYNKYNKLWRGADQGRLDIDRPSVRRTD